MNYNIQFPPLYEWQQAVFDDIKADDGKGNFYVVKAKRQCGKSILGIDSLLYFAFVNDRSIGTCIEPTLTQSRRVFKQIINAIGGTESPLLKSANATLLEMEFTNGSSIVLRSAEQGDALRGMTVKKSVLVIDEAAFIRENIFEILFPITDALRCPTLIISTPLFKDGTFYDKFILGQSGDDFTKSYDWSQYDTSALLSPERLEYYRRTISALKFRSEYLGEFIEEGSYLFGDFMHAVGAYSTKPSVYAGLDWGSVGSDSTVIIFFDEDRAVTNIKRWTGEDPVELVDKLAAEIEMHPTLRTVQVEQNSIGEIYFSMLRRKVRKGLTVRKFNTTNDSKRRIIERVIAAVQKGEIHLPNDAELIKQMQHLGAVKTPTGKMTYEGMDNVHDDYIMALCIGYDLFPDAEKNNKGHKFGFA